MKRAKRLGARLPSAALVAAGTLSDGSNRSRNSYMSPTEATIARDAGDRLLEQGKLTAQQLDQVRRRQQRLNLPQHRAIVDLNFASEEDTWRALAEVNHLEFVDPIALDLKRDLLEQVPIKFIFHYHLLPVRLERD